MNREKSLYHPIHWPVWGFLGVMRLLVFLPLPLLLWLGRQFGSFLYLIARQRRQIAQTNLSRAFPELDSASLTALTKAHFRSLGMGFFETVFAWWASERRIRAVSLLIGAEQLNTFRAKGQGLILMGAHFTCMEMMGRILALDHHFAVTYRPHENPVMERMYQAHRGRCYDSIISRNDVRAMVRWLKNGGAIWLAPDQNVSSSDYVFAPFFGIPAATTTSMSRLTRMGKAALLPQSFERTSDHGRYQMTIHPPVTPFPTEDIQADTNVTMQLIEKMVRPHPEQYLWIHRRFKHRPPGAPPFYS